MGRLFSLLIAAALAAWTVVCIEACTGEDPPIGGSPNADASPPVEAAADASATPSNDDGSVATSDATTPTTCDGGLTDCGEAGCVDLASNSSHCGACNSACGRNRCANKECTARLVFVTTGTYDGNLGGLTGADKRCQDSAIDAGLGGRYEAWLSTTTEAAALRLEQAPVPYELRNGAKVADNWSDLVDGTLTTAIGITEKGGVPVDTFAWTSTATNGQKSDPPDDCTGWATTSGRGGRLGRINTADQGWTESTETSFRTCDTRHPLYCFEQRN